MEHYFLLTCPFLFSIPSFSFPFPYSGNQAQRFEVPTGSSGTRRIAVLPLLEERSRSR